MITVDLYWHRDDEDLNLGKAYLDALPPAGSLLSWTTPVNSTGVWRIGELYIHPAQGGSMAVVHASIGGRNQQVAIYHAFVEPAEGPFHD
jgi:acetyl-CoA acetyltransferase